MKTLDFETIPNLSKLLASEGWLISEYKVDGETIIALKIVYLGKKKEGEGKNG
jgi:hypothetical protein